MYEEGLGVKQSNLNAFIQHLETANYCDALAQQKIGLLYENGIGIEQNYNEAFKSYLKAALRDQVLAQYKIGLMYEGGIGVEQDYLKAFNWYQLAANYDDERAQYKVGSMYENGLGVKLDFHEAFSWYLNAALNGNSKAHYNIGVMYENGLGVEQDYLEAFRWYAQPARQGDVNAQYCIGNIYESALGVKQDLQKAFRWYLKAAKQNHALAQKYVGYQYKNGLGVEQNYQKAFGWYIKAVNQEVTDIYIEIGNMYAKGLGVQQNYQEAHEYYLKAVAQGYPEASVIIGDMHANGLGLLKSYSNAYKWYLKAVDQNYPEGCIAIADMYATGQGVIQSSDWANKWYSKAKKMGSTNIAKDDKKMDNFISKLKAKLAAYKDTSKAQSWLTKNVDRLEQLYSDGRIRNFVFEPIKDVFALSGKDERSEVHAAITRVAIANAVLAGLPGKMGVGIVVSIALEAWMAYVIAKRVGIKMNSTAEIWKYMGMFAAMITVILWGFKALLGLGFSAFSVIPGINPLILAELFVTDLVGILFYCAWQHTRDNGEFKVPARALKSLWSETKALFNFQYDILKNNLSLTNLKMMGLRLKAWLSGDIPSNNEVIRGELFTTLAMGWLLAGQYDRLDGPIGQEFIAAIRDRYPSFETASIDDIADHMSNYDPEQMVGVISLIKGKLFERLVTNAENSDNDTWQAHMHDDESYPGSDIIMTNDDTGEVLEISLKATDSVSYIESSLLKYPDIPIMSTDEVAQYFDDNPMIMTSGFSNEELRQITEQNFSEMLDRLSSVDVMGAAATGVSAGATLSLWPFVMAYLKKRITQEQLEKAFKKVLGESGVALASRLSYAVILGPVFAWYLLARGVIGATKYAEQTKASHRVSYIKLIPKVDETEWQPA